MIIDLASIGTSRKAVELDLGPTGIDLDGESVSLTGLLSFKGETERVNGRAHVRGSIDADVAVDCTRCLEPVAQHLAIEFDDVFVEAAAEPVDPESHVEDDELDESLVEDGRIDIADVVREQILLAVPLQIFCSDDCKGLCPQCGGNLNLIDCKCADEDIDPRWAALKNLK